MIKKLINGKASSITSAALILAISSLASKVLGLYRDRTLLGSFGLGNELDVYYAAFRIPDFIFNIVVLGALSAGFIPVFAKLIHENKENEAMKTANSVMNLLFIFIFAFCILGIFFAPNLTGLITPGFTDDNKVLASNLTKIMFLSPMFLLLSGITGGILQSHKRFFIYSLSPIVYNIGIIIGALYFSKWWGLEGLAWGVVLGSAMHFFIQLPMAYRLGYAYSPILDVRDAGVRMIVRMMVPRTLTLVTSQFNLVVITIIATTLSAGSLTAFNAANNLQSFPLSLFAVSFAVAAFPTLSALSGEKSRNEFARSLTVTTKQILFFVIPISIILVALRAQIVRTILGTGKVGWEETALLFDSLAIFSFSLFAQSVIPLFSRAFWALHDAKTPFYVSFFSVIVNIFFSIALSNEYGLRGLVASFSISSALNALMLYYLINKKTNFACHSRMCFPLVKISLASIIAGIISHYSLYAIEPLLDTHTGIGIFTQGLFAGILGICAYCILSWKLDIEEFIILKDSLKRKLLRTKIVTSEIVGEE